MKELDWQFIPESQKSGPVCYKLDSTILNENDELEGLCTQCEHFIQKYASKCINHQKVCESNTLSKMELQTWASSWSLPLVVEVCWTSEQQICKVCVSVPHWSSPEKTCLVSLSHNGSWCVCRVLNEQPHMCKCKNKKANTNDTKGGIYLEKWQPFQRVLGDQCSNHASYFHSPNAWKLDV